ncbi:ABC-type branched-subunit amino acid transport system substrate-binding protein OS=Castellaniella defragrans OX=75697 GN=HNR28_001742 PE=3 SV=1 [Castellaniella defragrans]
MEDGETNPDAAVRAAQKLIGVNNVKAILGTWASGVTLAVAPLAVQAGIVEMHTSGSDKINQLDSRGLVWRFQPEAKWTGTAVAEAVKKEGWKTAASAARDDPSGVTTVEDFNAVFQKMGGKISTTLKYAPGQPSYTDVVRKLARSKPDVVFTSTYAPELSVLLKDSLTANMKLNWIAPGWAVTKDFINAVGPKNANGVWAVDSAPNIEGAAYKQFMAEFTQATGKTLLPSDTYVFSSYDMVNVLALAMLQCNCDGGQPLSKAILKVTNPPGEAVTSYAEGYKALKEGKDINYQGASSNLDFNEKGNQIPRFGVYRVVNGAVQLQDTFDLQPAQ